MQEAALEVIQTHTKEEALRIFLEVSLFDSLISNTPNNIQPQDERWKVVWMRMNLLRIWFFHKYPYQKKILIYNEISNLNFNWKFWKCSHFVHYQQCFKMLTPMHPIICIASVFPQAISMAVHDVRWFLWQGLRPAKIAVKPEWDLQDSDVDEYSSHWAFADLWCCFSSLGIPYTGFGRALTVIYDQSLMSLLNNVG